MLFALHTLKRPMILKFSKKLNGLVRPEKHKIQLKWLKCHYFEVRMYVAILLTINYNLSLLLQGFVYRGYGNYYLVFSTLLESKCHHFLTF